MWGEEKAQAKAQEKVQDGGQPQSAAEPSAIPDGEGTTVLSPPPSVTAAQRDEAPEGTARLYLNLGRKDGAELEQIRSVLRDFAGVDNVPSIDVMNTHTYLNVATEDADRICAALTGKQLGDRDLVCERARPRRR